MTIELSTDMSGFFRERLVAAMARRHIQATDATEVYLVQLLAGFVSLPATQTLETPLVHRLAEALEADTPRQRFEKFRELGDNALYVCGFFSDHLERRGISRGYVVGMGGRAYVAAGDLASRRFGRGFDQVYEELADGFDDFARILDEVRESTSLRTPQDIVRLYERWRRTRSPLLAERLEEEGVFPQAPDDDRVLH